MTQDDIVVMAVNSGANVHFVKHHIKFIEAFAKLIAAKAIENYVNDLTAQVNERFKK